MSRAGSHSNSILIGDDAERLAEVAQRAEGQVSGVVAPQSVLERTDESGPKLRTDGGGPLGRTAHLGALGELDRVLSERDVEQAVLAFSSSHGSGLFDALATCDEQDVAVRVHDAHTDAVLVDGESEEGELPVVARQPWSRGQRVLKRLFDVAFAGTALALFAPFALLVSVAIKLDSAGPVLFVQDRTKRLGQPFDFRKFRSMVDDAEEQTGVVVSAEDAGEVDPRITRVGRFLRATHIDEVPQLWSVLVGDMSVVGPRPAQHELEPEFVRDAPGWQKRWFVKPGLTGLAQLNGATGHEPKQKLQYDLDYIRRQSFALDVKLVATQLLEVVGSVTSLVTGDD